VGSVGSGLRRGLGGPVARHGGGRGTTVVGTGGTVVDRAVVVEVVVGASSAAGSVCARRHGADHGGDERSDEDREHTMALVVLRRINASAPSSFVSCT
jgi:hypothetical protein